MEPTLPAAPDRRWVIRAFAAAAAAPLVGCADHGDGLSFKLRWALDTRHHPGLSVADLLQLARDEGYGCIDFRRSDDLAALVAAGEPAVSRWFAGDGPRLGYVRVPDLGRLADIESWGPVAAAAPGLVVPVAGDGDLRGPALKGAVLGQVAALERAAGVLGERGLGLAVENAPGTLVSTAAALQLVGIHVPMVGLAVSLASLDPAEQPLDVTLENLGRRPVRVGLPGGGDREWDAILLALDRIAFAGRLSLPPSGDRSAVEARRHRLG